MLSVNFNICPYKFWQNIKDQVKLKVARKFISKKMLTIDKIFTKIKLLREAFPQLLT